MRHSQCHKKSFGSWDPLKNQDVFNMSDVITLQTFLATKMPKQQVNKQLNSHDRQFLDLTWMFFLGFWHKISTSTCPTGKAAHRRTVETGAPGYFGARLWRPAGKTRETPVMESPFLGNEKNINLVVWQFIEGIKLYYSVLWGLY